MEYIKKDLPEDPDINASFTTTPMQCARGSYEEIMSFPGSDIKCSSLLDQFKECLPESGVLYKSRRWFETRNFDFYGFDPGQGDNGVALIQIRQSLHDRDQKRWTKTRKNYVICGRDEGQTFAHEVGYHAARSRKAMTNDPRDAVHAAQRWVFDVKQKQLMNSLNKRMRQGDVLLVEQKRGPSVIVEELGREFTAMRHSIRASRIVRDDDGQLWAIDPALRHLGHEHDPVYADVPDIWHSVRIGQRLESRYETWD